MLKSSHALSRPDAHLIWPLSEVITMSKRLILVSVAVVVVVGGAVAWWILSKPGLPPGFAGGNGRLEAKQVDISTKYPGRIKEVLANEGDTVDAGQVVATMDTEPLEAQLRAANAKIREAQDNRNTALAEVTVKQSELDYADKQYKRSKDLVGRGAVSEQERDIDLARADASRAALIGAKAQAVRTQSAIDAAQGEADRLAAEIKDNTLKAPIRARVQTRMAEPGEVLPAGGKVLSMADLSDVYMYVFLPANVSGKVALGSEARIVLDAIPEYPLRAVISFVSPSAQFTPKTVETAEERHNLSFRVKLQLDKERLRNYERLVKVGIPGMGYVRFDMNAAWPPKLESNPNAQIPWNPTGSTDSTGAASPAGPTDSTGAASSAASSTGPTGTQ
jgi:HlyD family secretion protein